MLTATSSSSLIATIFVTTSILPSSILLSILPPTFHQYIRAQSRTPRKSKGRVSFPADSVDNSPAPATPTPAPRSLGSPTKRSSSSSSVPNSPAVRRRKSSVMSSKSLSKEQLGPKTKHYEFAGPPGAAFVSLSVPFFAYYLYFGCSEKLGCALTLPIDNPDALRKLFVQGVKAACSTRLDGLSMLHGTRSPCWLGSFCLARTLKAPRCVQVNAFTTSSTHSALSL